MKFFLNLSFQELNLSGIELRLGDIVCKESKLLGKCNDLSAAELNLFDLVLCPIVEQLLLLFRIYH